MPVKFTFEAYSDKLVRRELDRLSARGVDARPAFSAIADDLMGFEVKRFDTRGEGTWRPLALSTIREKARKGLDPRILHATLALRNSLTRRGDPEQDLTVAPQYLLFGSRVSYAKYQQRGTTRTVHARGGDTMKAIAEREGKDHLETVRLNPRHGERLKKGDAVRVVHMPARKPLGFAEEQKRVVLKRLQRFLVTGNA